MRRVHFGFLTRRINGFIDKLILFKRPTSRKKSARVKETLKKGKKIVII